MEFEKLLNWMSVAAGVAGGTIAGLLGGWDALLFALLALVILDYLTGIIKAVYTKTLSSDIGFKGLLKKIMVFLVVAAGHVVQCVIGGGVPLREIILVFFIANEGLSLLENAAVFIPIPPALRDALIQLRSEDEKKDGEDRRP